MRSKVLPIRVAILEDDPLARVGLEQLLKRDLRTEVLATFGRADALLHWLKALKRWKKPHVLLIDAEYKGYPGLPQLFTELREHGGDPTILLLSQYGGEELIRLAATLRAEGLVLKKEIGLAVATAVYLAHRRAPVYSSALDSTLDEMAIEPEVRRWRHKAHRLPRWRLLPDLSERQKEVAWHCLIYGMSAQLTGEEIALATNSVQKYQSHLYDKIEKHGQRELDLEPLAPVMHRLYRVDPHKVDRRSAGEEEDDVGSDSNLSVTEKQSQRAAIYIGDEWAFHVLTQLPRRDSPRHAVDRHGASDIV